MIIRRLLAWTVLSLAVAQAAHASIVVSSYRAVASTNAFAPLDKSNYFDEHVVQNQPNVDISASGDWVGTNYGSSTNTWHWVGSARTIVAATASMNSLAILGAATFSYDMTTTPDFLNPNQSVLQYAPGSISDYRCVFSLDIPGYYTMSGNLQGATLLQLYSVTSQSYIQDVKRAIESPRFEFDAAGVLSAGEYALRVNASLGGAPNAGESHAAYSGTITDFLFTVQIPEPSTVMIVFPAVALATRKGRRFGRDPVNTRP